jgi:MFS transporter, ACS family, tartrate transporter
MSIADSVAALVTERDPVRRAVALAFRRLLPLIVLMHVIAYADRVNITFAETEISNDLALSATVFGLAAGIFFASYVLFEVPSPAGFLSPTAPGRWACSCSAS